MITPKEQEMIDELKKMMEFLKTQVVDTIEQDAKVRNFSNADCDIIIGKCRLMVGAIKANSDKL